MNRPVAFIARETKSNHHSLNVLLAALEKYTDAAWCFLDFTDDLDILIQKIHHHFQQGRLPVIGWSFQTADAQKSIIELQSVRKTLTGVPALHIAGGAHASAVPEELVHQGFDFIFTGEGEQLLTDFIQQLIKGSPAETLPRIIHAPLFPGVWLDDYPPFPEKILKLNPIEITRGCIYACFFCQTSYLFGARFRHRCVEQIVHYAELLVRRGGQFLRMTTPSAFSYGSENAHPCLDQVETLLAALRKVMGKQRKIYFGTFPSEIRPEHVTAESMKLLRHYADNDNIIIGAQSGSEKILRACHRNGNPDQIIQATEIAQRNGFRVNVDFIFGLPGEEEKDRLDTLVLIRRLSEMKARIHAHWFMPLPGTPFANQPAGLPDEQFIRSIHQLMAVGKIYGQWKKQIGYAIKSI